MTAADALWIGVGPDEPVPYELPGWDEYRERVLRG